MYICVCVLQLAKSQGNVFVTDAIMSTLMCATRSVYSWDIIVQKVGKKLFFDKRDESEFGQCTFARSYVLQLWKGRMFGEFVVAFLDKSSSSVTCVIVLHTSGLYETCFPKIH